jgi:hypothetical protein
MLKPLLQILGNRKQVKSIIIVSGLPRSGTSMMMKILEAGGIPPLIDSIRTPDEDNPKGYYEFERVKKLDQGDFTWLADARGKAVKIIAALLIHLPTTHDYRVIFMNRALPEIMASQRKMLIHRGEDPHKISDDQLITLFEKHLSQVNSWINSQPNIKRIDINYNQVLENPGPQIEQVNRFLGNTLDVNRMLQVIDPNLYRQRR